MASASKGASLYAKKGYFFCVFVKMQGCVAVAFVWYCMLIQLTSLSAGAPKDSVAKQLLDSSAAVDVYFKGALICYSFIGTCNRKKNFTSTLNVCVHIA